MPFKPITPDPNPRPWLARDIRVKNVQLIKTVELVGPKGDKVVVNECDQESWTGRGYKATGKASPQDPVTANSLQTSGTFADDDA